VRQALPPTDRRRGSAASVPWCTQNQPGKCRVSRQRKARRPGGPHLVEPLLRLLRCQSTPGQHDAQNIQPALVIRRGARFTRRALPTGSSHMNLITGTCLHSHRRRRGPPRPGERPASVLSGSRKSANIHTSSEVIWEIPAQFTFFPLPFLLRENRLVADLNPEAAFSCRAGGLAARP
jgi:hypothetical protein